MSFTPVKIGDQLDEAPTGTSKILFENDAGFTKRTDTNMLNFGPNVVLVSSEDDLPPMVSGFHQLDPLTSYKFIKAGITITNPILIPAGYIGYIENTFLDSNGVIYIGTISSFFNTLNISKSILSIANSPGDPGNRIVVTLDSSHTLINGDYVNITDTTSYNAERLLVSDVTATTFEVPGTFGVTETGNINTGYLALQFRNFVSASANPAHTALSIISSGSPNSSFTMLNCAFFGYAGTGLIENGINALIHGSLLVQLTGSFEIRDSDSVNITNCVIAGGDPSSTQPALKITGTETNDVGIININFKMAALLQSPILIDSAITNARFIRIQTCPDNGIATDYFDSSGLDETNPQVIAVGNSIRKNSMASAQTGFTNISTPIVITIDTINIPVIINGSQFVASNLERATADTSGQITNLTKQTKKYPITFSALIEKVAGGITDIGLLLIKNGVLDLLATFEIPHSVNSGVIQISATRDFELVDGDTLDIAVVNFANTDNIEVSQANIAYSVEI